MNICIDVSLHVLCPATSPSSWKDKLRIRRIMDDRYHHRNRKQNKYNSLERQTYKSCVKTKYRCQAWCIRQQNKFCRANINSFKLRPMNRQNMASPNYTSWPQFGNTCQNVNSNISRWCQKCTDNRALRAMVSDLVRPITSLICTTSGRTRFLLYGWIAN